MSVRIVNAESALSKPLFSSYTGLPISKLTGSPRSFSLSLGQFGRRRRGGGAVVAALDSATITPLTGVVFQPFEEVKNDAFVVPVTPQASLARQRYAAECEAAINEQIK